MDEDREITLKITIGMIKALSLLSQARRDQEIAYYDYHYEDVCNPTSDNDVALMARRKRADKDAQDALQMVGWHFERIYRYAQKGE